jgi:Glyoxalase/Bleomycin resistance protein/Dioxygenase superfamily
LNQVSFTDRGALSHMGIQVASTEDVFAQRERWSEAGLITKDEMQTNCCYAKQDKTWVYDPDGNAWEVFVVLEDNLTETSMCCATDDMNESKVTSPSEVISTERKGSSAQGSCGCTSSPKVSLSR